AVSDARGLRTLHVGGEAIQSAMRIDDPHALALDYTRCMMAFLLVHPEPREALMIGLGGGSLAKFFHRRLRSTKVRVVELDARVLAAARAHFALPPDDERLLVEIGDGAEALYPECCDLLVVDAFDDEVHVPKLASSEFYDAAFLALREPGALVVGVTGFGSALVTIPLATHFVPLQFALPLFALVDLCTAFSIGLENPRNAARDEWGRLVPMIVVGTALGVTLLVKLPRAAGM